MGMVILDNFDKAMKANSDWHKFAGDLLRLYNSNVQMFNNVHLTSSPAIWQTIAEFTVVSSLEDNRVAVSWQLCAYSTLNFGGSHLLLSLISALFLLATEVRLMQCLADNLCQC
jgi:hypothetical protein